MAVIIGAPGSGLPESVRLRFHCVQATPDTLRHGGLCVAAPRVARQGEAWWRSQSRETGLERVSGQNTGRKRESARKVSRDRCLRPLFMGFLVKNELGINRAHIRGK